MCCAYTGEWEYHCLRPRREETKKEANDPTTQLNRLGSDGWELVETIAYTGGGTKYLIFKRPAAYEPSDDENESDEQR